MNTLKFAFYLLCGDLSKTDAVFGDSAENRERLTNDCRMQALFESSVFPRK